MARWLRTTVVAPRYHTSTVAHRARAMRGCRYAYQYRTGVVLLVNRRDPGIALIIRTCGVNPDSCM